MSTSILMAIAPDQFRDEELNVPREIFKKEGWQVTVVSTRSGEATGMLGQREAVSYTLDDVQPETYDAIVVVGGMGSPEYLWEAQKLHSILKAMQSQSKVISAICLSGAVLAKAGLLKGKKATVWETPETKQILIDSGAQYTAEPCTVDGNIITANGPDAAESFGKAIVAQVKAAASVAP